MSTSSPMADENSPDATRQPETQVTQINTDGGPAIHGNVNPGDDFVARDKIVNNYYGGEPKPAAGSNEALMFIPFLRKSATEFVGRDAELAELHAKLQQSQMVGVRPAAALTGLGGIGKTQLAVEYAYRYQTSYPGGIFWINAADLNRVRSALVETAERMGLRTDHNTTDNALLAGLVKRCQQQPATLLCFDSAPDAVILWRRLTQELNTATLGAAILITTRRRDLPPNIAALDLRRLSDNTVRQLLATARPDLITDPELPRLLERLGGLPLVVNLVANALQNSPDATIADYLAALAQHGEETVHEELDVHVEDYDLYRGIYTRTLLPVLREQWDRLCQQPKSENAQLLLRIAGQLPEAAEIPIARLGLLAGLEDGKVIKPLKNAVDTLWKLALIEELKADAIRLHPLVREFAFGLLNQWERYDFCHECARNLAVFFEDLSTLELNCRTRGIASVIADILTARYFLSVPLVITPYPRPIPSQPDFTDLNLYTLLRILRREMHNLQDNTMLEYTEHFLQQCLYRSWTFGKDLLAKQASALLISHRKSYFRPIWAARRESPKLEQTLSGHRGSVQAVAVLDTNRIVSASVDGVLKVWNLATDIVEQSLIGYKDRVKTVAVLDANHIVSASDDGTLKVWNLATSVVERTLPEHAANGLAVVVLDANRIVSASVDGTLKVWNLATGVVEQTLVGHKDLVNAVAVLDVNRIISASDDLTLKVWNLATGKVERTLVGHKDCVNTVAVLNANRIVSASNDGTLKVWNLAIDAIEQTLVGHEDWINAVAVLDANRIVSASDDRTLKVWNLTTGKVEQVLAGHGYNVNAVAVLNADRIVSASDDRTLKVWNLATSAIEKTLVEYENWSRSVTVLNANRIVSASIDYTLKVWNLDTGTIEQTLVGHEDRVNALAVLDTNYIVSASVDRTLKVWNLATGTVKQTLVEHEESVLALAVLDANHIVSASVDRTLKVWNLATGTVEQTLSGHKYSVNAVIALDADHIVSASDDCTLKVWNLVTGAVEQTLTGHENWVNALAVLDTNHIVSASVDGTFKVWNLVTGAVEQTLAGHADSVNAVIALDANRIVSVSDDRMLKVWNLQTEKEIASISLDSALQCVAVAQQRERTLVVTGDAAGAIYCLEWVESMASVE